MSFAKALVPRSSTDRDEPRRVVTGMNGFYTLDMTQRADLAAFIAGIVGPAPILRYRRQRADLPATAVGATASATVTITNVGTGIVIATNDAVTMATGGDVADFRITASSCPGRRCVRTPTTVISVIFQPTAGASLTRTASIGLTTTSGTSLVPMAGSVSSRRGDADSLTSAANPPASGGGGALDWLAAIGLLILPLIRRSPRRLGAWNLTSVRCNRKAKSMNFPTRSMTTNMFKTLAGALLAIASCAALAQPAITASGTTLSFATQTPVLTTNSTSTPSTITLTNSGTEKLTITGIEKAGRMRPSSWQPVPAFPPAPQ